MKKIKYIIAVALAAVTLSSCEKNFDPQIYGTFNTTIIPSSVEDVNNLVASCYLPFTSFWTYVTGSGEELCWYSPANGTYLVFDLTSDLAGKMVCYGNTERTRFSAGNYSNAVNFARTGAGDSNINHMHGVADVSRMTKTYDVIENCDCISDAQKAKFLGEIALCRALSMYYTIHYYGPLPFIRNAEDLTSEEALFSLERPSLEECTKWITEDMEFAVQNIWDKGEINQNGRYNKDYAKVCLARHYLNEGYYMDGYYEKAAKLCKEIMDSGRYALFNKTTNVNPYVDQFASANGFNSEVIGAVDVVPNGNNAVMGNYNAIAIYCANGWAAPDATHNPTWGIIGSAWGSSYNVSTKFYDTFEKDDLRTACIDTSYIASSKYSYYKVTRDLIGSWWDGFILNKYRPEVKGTYQPNDLPLARYAEVLLLYAEALTRKDGSVSADAVNAVNQVRKRAGIADLPASSTASKDAFLEAILVERGHELYFEGQRKIDLVRFNKYATNLAIYKGVVPSHQYVPLPNYAVQQAEEHGCTLTQTYERPEYAQDLSTANSLLNK